MLFIRLAWIQEGTEVGGKAHLFLNQQNVIKCSAGKLLEPQALFKERKQNSNSYRNTKKVRNASLKSQVQLFGHRCLF